MRKLFFITALTIISLLSNFANAEQPGRYVRKQLKPTFFIPDKEMNRSEKLPEFNYYPNETKKIIVKTKVVQTPEEIEEVSEDVVHVLEVINEVDMNDRRPQAQLPILAPSTPVKVESKYINYDKDELARIPEYQQKYDDYINDLKAIAKTGTTPENTRVTQDLSKMNSNNRIIVDESFGLIPEASSEAMETPVTQTPQRK